MKDTVVGLYNHVRALTQDPVARRVAIQYACVLSLIWFFLGTAIFAAVGLTLAFVAYRHGTFDRPVTDHEDAVATDATARLGIVGRLLSLGLSVGQISWKMGPFKFQNNSDEDGWRIAVCWGTWFIALAAVAFLGGPATAAAFALAVMGTVLVEWAVEPMSRNRMPQSSSISVATIGTVAFCAAGFGAGAIGVWGWAIIPFAGYLGHFVPFTHPLIELIGFAGGFFSVVWFHPTVAKGFVSLLGYEVEAHNTYVVARKAGRVAGTVVA